MLQNTDDHLLSNPAIAHISVSELMNTGDKSSIQDVTKDVAPGAINNVAPVKNDHNVNVRANTAYAPEERSADPGSPGDSTDFYMDDQIMLVVDHLELSLPDHFREIMYLLTYEPISVPSLEWELEESVQIIVFPAETLRMKESSSLQYYAKICLHPQ